MTTIQIIQYVEKEYKAVINSQLLTDDMLIGYLMASSCIDNNLPNIGTIEDQVKEFTKVVTNLRLYPRT